MAGLAWTNYGGTTLFIEARKIPTNETTGVGKLTITGKLRILMVGQIGDVMKESIQIAYSFAKSFLNEVNKNEHSMLEKEPIHIHIPEGATPKDGPSAGVTIVTTMLSLSLNK